LNALYEATYTQGVDIYYVMLEDEDGNLATQSYCNMWKTKYEVAPPVVVDYSGFMWSFYPDKQPGTGLIIDKKTMKLLSVTSGGDQEVYNILFDMYLN